MRVRTIHGAVGNSVLRVLTCCLVAAALLLSFDLKIARAQNPLVGVSDPGVRPWPQPANGAGNPLAELPSDQNIFWFDGLVLFGATASVKGALSGDPPLGFGPALDDSRTLLVHL